MAIERNLDVPPAPDTGMDTPTTPEASPGEGATEETASIPASIIGGQTVAPGDVIRLQVVSMDGDQITVKYAAPEGEEAPETAPEETPEEGGKGIKGMAAAFD